jgi:MFS transporter, FSR family, fosmidomycin resistance protein
MVLFFLGTGGASVATGFATGPAGLALGLTGIGLFGSIYHPVGIAWLVRMAENRGRALGLNGIFGSIGVGGAAILAGFLADFVGWRAVFVVPGLLCASCGVALLVLMSRGLVVAAKADRVPEPEPERADVVRAFFVLSVTMLGTGLVGQVMTVVMPKLFEERVTGLGGGILGVGGCVTLVYVATALAQLLGGWLADRYPLKRVYILSWLVQIPVFLAVARFSGLPLVAVVMLVSCLAICGVPAENSLLARYTPGRWRATAYGAKFVLALGVSAAGIPLAGGVHDATGNFAMVFVILGAVSLIVGATALLLPRERAGADFSAVPAGAD